MTRRWPLLAIGSVPFVFGLLVAWATFLYLGGGPTPDQRLDRGPVRCVEDKVQRVEAPAIVDGRALQLVTYSVPLDERAELRGMTLVPANSAAVGQTVPVELLAADGSVHRIVGGRVRLDRRWVQPRFWLAAVVVPGALLLLGWLTAVLQLRGVMVHGDASLGVVHRVRPVRGVLPEMLRVDYTFRDHRAQTRHGWQWVRRHGELGRRLLEQMRTARYEELPVLHDRRHPEWSRLVLPQDFLRPARTDRTLPNVSA